MWTLRDVVDFIRQVALRELGYERSRHDGARSRREHAISRLVRNPAGMQVISSEQGAAVVRSARHADSSHLVCLADATCTCRDAAAGEVCVHLEAVDAVHGGGAIGAQERALKVGAELEVGGGSVMLASRSEREAAWRSLTTWPYTRDAALEAMGSARRRPLYGSRQKAVVTLDGPVPTCSCNLYGCQRMCAHVVAELLRKDRMQREGVDCYAAKRGYAGLVSIGEDNSGSSAPVSVGQNGIEPVTREPSGYMVLGRSRPGALGGNDGSLQRILRQRRSSECHRRRSTPNCKRALRYPKRRCSRYIDTKCGWAIKVCANAALNANDPT